MSDEPIIAVVGATGAQGGGLVRAILDDHKGRFRVRALTRNPSSDAGQGLASRGAEVVRADLDDPATLDDAFDGVHGAYLVTNFWEHFSPEKEKAQARNLAEAVKRRAVPHVVWSTLDDTREHVPLSDDRMPTLLGDYKVPHFDAKGEADAYFRDLEVPTTFFRTSFYWDNLIHFGMHPQRGEDGVLRLTMPMGEKKLPGIAAEDIGKCAFGVFAAGDEFIGRTIGIAGGHPTGSEMAAVLTDMLGEPVEYNDVPPDVFRGFGFPGAEDLGNMFQFYQEFEEYYTGSRDLELSKRLNPELLDFRAWAEKYASKIPLD